MGNPSAQSEAGRIWLARLPALPPFRGNRLQAARPALRPYGPGQLRVPEPADQRSGSFDQPAHALRGRGKFFPMSEFVYATQTQWQDKIAGMSEAEKAAVDQMTDEQRVVRFAELGGMDQIAAKFGVTSAQARQCLADPKGLKRLLDMTKRRWTAGSIIRRPS